MNYDTFFVFILLMIVIIFIILFYFVSTSYPMKFTLNSNEIIEISKY